MRAAELVLVARPGAPIPDAAELRAGLRLAADEPLRLRSVEMPLIDGVSGGGAQLWFGWLNIPAVVGERDRIVISGLNLVGTANTAMTLEFNAAAGANTYESVSMTGYTT